MNTPRLARIALLAIPAAAIGYFAGHQLRGTGPSAPASGPAAPPHPSSSHPGNATTRTIEELPHLSRRDPVRGISGGREAPIGNLWGEAARRDPEAALAALRQLASPAERERALRGIASELSASDPEMAAVFAAGLQPSPAQSELLEQIGRRYAARSPEAAFAWAQSMPEGITKLNILQAIAEGLVRSDPRRALALVENFPAGDRRERGLRHLAHLWAEHDFGAALAWVQGRSDVNERHATLLTMLSQWARADLHGSLAFALSLPGTKQSEALQQIGRFVALQSPADLLRWTAQLPEGAARKSFYGAALTLMIERSPAEAAALISREPNPDRHATQWVAQQWSHRDPSAAAQWLRSLPPAQVPAEAARHVANNWTNSDPQSSAHWIGSLPPGPLRDAAMQGSVDALALRMPEMAAGLALQIGDTGRRHRAMEDVARTWLSVNRTAASAWLAQTTLPPNTKQRLLGR